MTIETALGAVLAKSGIPGAVAMVGNRAGTVTSHALGVRDSASGAAMTLDTVFQMASMTKAVTSVAAMQLVEAGALSLDAPIANLLPKLANPQVIEGFGDDGAPLLRPAKTAITLRHLLTHTAGFSYDFMSETLLRSRGPGGPPPTGTWATIETPLLFDPGERWEYGVNTDWVGVAVETASGMQLDRYFADHIFAPLGMADTNFISNAEQLARRAALQMRGPDGALSPFPIEIGGGPDVELLSGGGGLSGTAPDYLRFLRMILNGGSLDGIQILKPETVAEMTRNQIGSIRAGAMGTTMPAFALANDPFPDQQSGWGLGFLINPEKGPNGRAAGSLAWAGIANTYYWMDPASDVAGVIMMQHVPFADPAASEVYAAFERAVYAQDG